MTALCRCKQCKLLFRIPTTTKKENAAFYQKDYTQDFTTDLPCDEKLGAYLKTKFTNTEKDYSVYIEIVRKANGNDGIKLFDFGCSWDYGSWQLMQGGFDVDSYEISVPRAEFARKKLGINVHADLSAVTEVYDCFFSCHVLEHVPSIKDVINFGFRILKPGGTFIAITPNGSEARRIIDPVRWRRLWGMVHPNMLDDIFYASMFDDKSYFMTSSPYRLDNIDEWRKSPCQITDRKSGSELLIIARK